MAPFDVVLSSKDMFQPDVFVVLNANLHKLAKKKMIGAPDLVIAVAADSTAVFDRLNKYDVYARTGVPEYWIANPEARTIEVLVLEDGEYQSPGIFRGKAKLPSRVVPGLDVPVEQFFV